MDVEGCTALRGILVLSEVRAHFTLIFEKNVILYLTHRCFSLCRQHRQGDIESALERRARVSDWHPCLTLFSISDGILGATALCGSLNYEVGRME